MRNSDTRVNGQLCCLVSIMNDTKKSTPGKIRNRTFRGWEPTWANACVGSNGNPQIYEYAEGFAAAADLLLNEVIRNEGRNFYVDTFVYPVCFNMRHAVELYLKMTVQGLSKLASMQRRSLEVFDTASSHDLGRMWKFIQDNSVEIDSRFSSVICALEEYVSDFADIDSTGQVFRYPFGTDQRKHLLGVPVINFIILRERFSSVKKLFRELMLLIELLVEEYGWGTFTTHLSRKKLVALTRALPRRAEWSEPAFDITRKNLKEEFGVGSREFSKALNLIQARHELAALIGVEVAIPGLSYRLVSVLFTQWCSLHDIEEIKNPKPPRILDFEMVDFLKERPDYSIRRQAVDLIVDQFDAREFAVIRALYYFDREATYSEAFDRLLRMYLKEAEESIGNAAEYRENVSHLLDKTNLLQNVLNSLNFLGQKSLVDSLVLEFKLQECQHRILERSEELKSVLTK